MEKNEALDKIITNTLEKISPLHSREGDFSDRYIKIIGDEKSHSYPILKNRELINVLGDIERRIRQKKMLFLYGKDKKYANTRIIWSDEIPYIT